MTRTTRTTRTTRMTRLLARSVLAAVAAVAITGPPLDASAAARVTVTSSAGAGAASSSGSTTLTVRGSGFTSIPRAMGGIYVMFGTVEDQAGGSWRPSRGGASGVTFRYVPDAEAADNKGYQRFVAFPGSDTSDAANGGQLAADGSWSTTLTVPGPVITVAGRGGALQQVDCRTSTCGVITVGAHGVKNAANETFTPVRFAAAAGASAAPSTSRSAGPTSSTGPSTGSATGSATQEQATLAGGSGPATAGIDPASAVAGRVLSFTGRGFSPGEQVAAVLDGGHAGLGPLTAGGRGEVAALLQLPSDLRIGTHTLRMVGAASGVVAEVDFPVAADSSLGLGAAAATTGGTTSPGMIAVLIAAAVLAFVVLLGVFGAAQGRRRRPPEPAGDGPRQKPRQNRGDV